MCNNEGMCDDQNRDWCSRCDKCTEYNGEVCTECGRIWGHD